MTVSQGFFSNFKRIINTYPLARGMLSYSIIWPSGCAVQQVLITGEEKIDFARVARFSVYGALYVAPTLNLWITIARRIWPANTLGSAITKSLVEQVTYTPIAMTSFYFGMTLLEGRSIEHAKNEVKEKFWPTYKVGACIWPAIQTINWTYVSDKNRIAFVSMCSFIWTTFLAYMKHHYSVPVEKNHALIPLDR